MWSARIVFLWSRFMSITQCLCFLLLTFFQPQSPFKRDKAQRIQVKGLSIPAPNKGNKDNIKKH